MLKLRSDVKIVELSAEHSRQTFKWVQDPSVSLNVGLRSAPSIERTVEWIEKARSSDEIRAFAILNGENHSGNVILDRLDDYLSTARFSIYVGETDLRTSGIGRTATYLICRYGFENLSLNKVWLTVHSRNFRAINTYTQVGFKLEGILREEFLLNGEKIDALYMGLLKKDFESQEVSFI